MKKLLIVLCVLCIAIYSRAEHNAFCIANHGATAQIVVDSRDWAGVIRAARDLGDDVRKVTGTPSAVVLERIVVNPDNGCYSYFGPPTRD